MVTPGIHPNLGMAEYHRWQLDRTNLAAGPISCSMLKDFAANPYAWARSAPRKQTAALNTGNLFDLALTDPSVLDASVTVSPFDNYRTKAAQEWRDERAATGKLVVSQMELAAARYAAKEVWGHRIAGDILNGCEFQVGVIGDIKGIPAKCLIDILPHADSEWGETLVDYKTTSNGLDDEAIRATIGKYKYHWQAALYLGLFNEVSLTRVATDFVYIFQDPQTYEVRVVKLGDEALVAGGRAIKMAVTEFARCAKKGITSRYAMTVDSLDLMPYHEMAEDAMIEQSEGGEA
jgi:hypothetical protein